MNVHKFIVKPRTSTSPNLTIEWSLDQNLKYPPSKVDAITWKIFSQGDIVLEPKEVKPVKLGLGFRMSEGIVFVSSSNVLRKKLCSVQNEVIMEDVDDIITTLTNNSGGVVRVRENETLVLVRYKKF